MLPVTSVGAECQVKLQIPESEETRYTQDPPKVRPAMRSQKVKVADSDKRSIGTMTPVSDLDSEVFPILYWISLISRIR